MPLNFHPDFYRLKLKRTHNFTLNKKGDSPFRLPPLYPLRICIICCLKLIYIVIIYIYINIWFDGWPEGARENKQRITDAIEIGFTTIIAVPPPFLVVSIIECIFIVL
jgi:hypothetical protein